MKRIYFVLLGLFLALTLIRPAIAFTEGACKQDEEKYCKGKPLLGGELKKCMEKHVKQLSKACKVNIMEAMVKIEENKSK